MSAPFVFHPDIIVEVTSVCDRQCSGCYAPNLLSKEDPEVLFRAKPELFLSPEKLRATLSQMNANHPTGIQSISLRGGEPSRHPGLPAILSVANSFSSEVYLETHGRWILTANSDNAILSTCKSNGTYIKLSFDRMHGMDAPTLQKSVELLSEHHVRWMVAITEANLADFQRTRGLCPWVADDRIIFQTKVTRGEDLIQPKLGVIHLDGSVSNSLKNMLPPSNPNIFQNHRVEAAL